MMPMVVQRIANGNASSAYYEALYYSNDTFWFRMAAYRNLQPTKWRMFEL